MGPNQFNFALFGLWAQINSISAYGPNSIQFRPMGLYGSQFNFGLWGQINSISAYMAYGINSISAYGAMGPIWPIAVNSISAYMAYGAYGSQFNFGLWGL